MHNFFTRYLLYDFSFSKIMKAENESLVQMIWIERLLITDISNFSNESLKQVIISMLQMIVS